MSDTHDLREDAQRLLAEPDCLGAHVRDDAVAELEFKGTSLAPVFVREIGELDRHIVDVTTRSAHTVHVEIK